MFYSYHSGFLCYCLHLYYYIHDVSSDMSSGFLQVFLIELRSLHGTSNHVLYFIQEGRLLWFRYHNWVQVLSILVLFTHLQSGLNLQHPDDCYLEV